MNAEHPYLRLYGVLLSQLLFFALLFSSMLTAVSRSATM